MKTIRTEVYEWPQRQFDGEVSHNDWRAKNSIEVRGIIVFLVLGIKCVFLLWMRLILYSPGLCLGSLNDVL